MKNTRTITSKRPYLTVAIVLIAAATALFLLKNSALDNKKNRGAGRDHSQTDSNKLPPQYPDSTTASSTAPPPQPSTVETLPPPAPTPDDEPAPEEGPCRQTAEGLLQFFAHLESQEYIKAYGLNEPIHAYLDTIISKVLNHPPVNNNETADLLTVLNNASHLFRILGRKDLSLIKEIMTHEHATLEQQLASLYAWSTLGEECRQNSTVKFQIPLAKSYEYAAFFLNTLGGQSYLSRRDSTVRTLAKYYCVLIVSQAVLHSINRYDINLPYHLKAVLKEIENSDFLENQALYLATLKKIQAGP